MTKPTTILMTGAGGAALPFLIKSLQQHGYRVLAADMDPFAAGLFLADKGLVIPKADDPRFIPAIREICISESVDVIIPLVDEELIAVAEMQGTGAIPLTPRTEFIRTCLDKYQLVETLKKYGIPAPRTCLAGSGADGIGFPCIVKPRTGRGSREVELLHSPDDYRNWCLRTGSSANNYILQEYIAGTEYTVSVVAWRDGSVQSVVPKEIISKKGITRLAVTRNHAAIADYCTTIQEKLRGDGPFNVQLRCHEKTGQPLLFEINPRYSTTVSLTILAGIDEVHGLVRQALHGPDAYRFGAFTEGVVLMRHNEDYAVSTGRLETLQANIRTVL
jgi:carbamoyl-phosphate synthase large subunit